MDKYEYKVRAQEIRDLIASSQYEKAAEIADTIDWSRVKKSTFLCTISDLYKINKDKTETRMFEKTTGDEGTFLVEDLEWGSYFFVETAAPAGFEFDKDAKYGFEINRKNVNEIQLVYVDNTKKPGSVEIEKVDKDGNGPLDAVVFDLIKIMLMMPTGEP